MLKKYPSYVKFLDDKGKGNAPDRYLIAVEQCLRNVASDNTLAKFPMGKYAMMSYHEWINTKYWFKREAYIAAVRAYKGMGCYRKYIAYDWNDKVTRKQMAVTFFVRHRKYTNGEQKLDIPDPAVWSQNLTRHRKPAAARVPDSDDESEGLDSDGLQSKTYNSDTEMWE